MIEYDVCDQFCSIYCGTRTPPTKTETTPYHSANAHLLEIAWQATDDENTENEMDNADDGVSEHKVVASPILEDDDILKQLVGVATYDEIVDPRDSVTSSLVNAAVASVHESNVGNDKDQPTAPIEESIDRQEAGHLHTTAAANTLTNGATMGGVM